MKAFLDDEVSATVESQCAASPAAVSGIFIPDEPFASFDGESASGVWTLTLVDSFQGDSGILESWCLAATVGGQLPPPTPTPPPPALPPSSRIRNITGQPQALNLDCESRVAVDWAGYFGVYIDELEFFYRLPTSDNPDAGFVGNVHGKWGQVPPNPYGIHAEPVAALLREYGLPAYAHRPLSWDALRAELAAKRPVYVWVIGSVDNGIPEFYRSNDGHLSVVARKEHTVQVIGYNETNVFILDGGTTYSRSIPVFLASWSALGNMAITTQP